MSDSFAISTSPSPSSPTDAHGNDGKRGGNSKLLIIGVVLAAMSTIGIGSYLVVTHRHQSQLVDVSPAPLDKRASSMASGSDAEAKDISARHDVRTVARTAMLGKFPTKVNKHASKQQPRPATKADADAPSHAKPEENVAGKKPKTVASPPSKKPEAASRSPTRAPKSQAATQQEKEPEVSKTNDQVNPPKSKTNVSTSKGETDK